MTRDTGSSEVPPESVGTRTRQGRGTGELKPNGYRFEQLALLHRAGAIAYRTCTMYAQLPIISDETDRHER
jgi:hypothetical protein